MREKNRCESCYIFMTDLKLCKSCQKAICYKCRLEIKEKIICKGCIGDGKNKKS